MLAAFAKSMTMKKRYKGQLGHEQVFNIIVKIIIPLLIVFGGIFSLIWVAHGGLQKIKEEAMKERVTKEVEELLNDLSQRCKEESKYWVCDSYHASYLIAKIIKTIWSECLACDCCKEGLHSNAQPLARFFYNNPVKIEFSSCSDYGLNDIYSCPHEGIVSEWTVTAWGLRKELKFCGEKGFGNNNCNRDCPATQFGKQELDYSCEDVSENRCASICSGDDKLDWKAGIITAGEIINDLRFEYSDNKVIVKRDIWKYETTCDYIEFGKCKVEICPIAWDKSDNSDVKYGYYEVEKNSRATWVCDNPSDCEKNFKFSYSFSTSKEKTSLKENEIEITFHPLQKNAKNNIFLGFKLKILNEKECQLFKCERVIEPYYSCVWDDGMQRFNLNCENEVRYMLEPEKIRSYSGYGVTVSKIIFNYCGDKLCACKEDSSNCQEDC